MMGITSEDTDRKTSQRKRRSGAIKKYVASRLKIRSPVICIATNRFSRRYHVRESGRHNNAPVGRKASGHLMQLNKPGHEINPMKIAACSDRLATRRDVAISLEESLLHPDWCEECRAAVQSIVAARNIRNELGGAT